MTPRTFLDRLYLPIEIEPISDKGAFMDSRKMKFGEIEYVSEDSNANWFARVKVHNLAEAKKVAKEFESRCEGVTHKFRGRGCWNPQKVCQYYILKSLAGEPMPRRLPMDMPISLSDYVLVYFY